MFNKSYQLRAVRKAGGGHQVATKALLRLPEPWRALVTVAAAGEEVFYRPKRRVRPGKSKTAGQVLALSAQLELFPDNGAQKFTPLEILYTPVKNFAPDSARPLFDLFPEAYE